MIIFINGPFGIGKTTTAQEIVRLKPEMMIFDPEEIGAFLRRLLGSLAAENDYQDVRLWRELTVELADKVRREYGRDLVIPMSLYKREYLDEIIGGLRTIERDLVVVCLYASKDALRSRIDGSDEGRGWRLQHLDAFPTEPDNDSFGIPVDTNGRTPAEIAAEILSLANSY